MEGIEVARAPLASEGEPRPDGTPGRIDRILASHHDALVRALAARLRALRLRGLDPEDVLQDAAVLALRKVELLGARSEQGLLAWLLRAAEHEARNRTRASELRRCLPLDAPGAASPASSSHTPLEASTRSELGRILCEARAQLSLPHYLVIQLRDFEGRSWCATAQLLGGRTVHAAQELHRRAVSSLGRLLRRRLASEEALP